MRFFSFVSALGLLLETLSVSNEGQCLLWEKGISGFLLSCADCRHITTIQLSNWAVGRIMSGDTLNDPRPKDALAAVIQGNFKPTWRKP